MNKKVATIRDVAAAAGVSTATVSKFMNRAQRFSAPVEAAITDAISRLGYHSNPVAASMITGRTRSIGLSVLDVGNPHFTSIVIGVNRVALAHGYTLLLVDTEEDRGRERPLLEALSRRVDGVIVFSRMRESEMRWMTELGKPLVFFGRLEKLDIPWVISDDHGGAYMLTRHLISQGHRRIAYLSFATSRRDEERLGGIRECMITRGLQLTIYAVDAPTPVEGERICSSVMLGAEHPDAVICYNDLVALGFMKAAQSLGFKVPEDISVTGFDNIRYGLYSFPPLTTVDLQSERMGSTATEKLIAAIEGKPQPPMTTIDPQLVLRSSTMKRPLAL